MDLNLDVPGRGCPAVFGWARSHDPKRDREEGNDEEDQRARQGE
jgi:hypothetical protein